jgi:hypothetical protein
MREKAMIDRTCYLHVGTGKTGTSAIQYALTKSHDALLRRGYLYPDLSSNFKDVLALQPRAGNARLVGIALKNDRVKRALKLVKRYARRPEHLVLSSEGLSVCPEPALTEFAAGLHSLGFSTIKCVVFFRPQVDFIVSSYLQLVKSGKTTLNLDDFARRQLRQIETKYDWLARTEKLERVFSPDNLTVKWYPTVAGEGPNGVVAAIFSWLGLPDMASAVGPMPVVNPSPGRDALEVLLTANRNGSGGKAFADEFLARAHAEGRLGPKVSLSPRMRRLIERQLRDPNDALARRMTDLSGRANGRAA